MGPLSTIRARATYANVTATVALFAALGGGSFAVAALGGSEKAVVKKIAKKQADKRITARAKDLTVKHATSADAATNAGHASNADSATKAAHATNANHAVSADDSSALDGLGASDFARAGEISPAEVNSVTGPSTPGQTAEQVLEQDGQLQLVGRCTNNGGGSRTGAMVLVRPSLGLAASINNGALQGAGEVTVATVTSSGNANAAGHFVASDGTDAALAGMGYVHVNAGGQVGDCRFVTAGFG